MIVWYILINKTPFKKTDGDVSLAFAERIKDDEMYNYYHSYTIKQDKQKGEYGYNYSALLTMSRSVMGDNAVILYDTVPETIENKCAKIIVIKKLLTENKEPPRKYDDFELDSCFISITQLSNSGLSGHTIAGLICEEQYYVFDSNNILAKTNWENNDFSGYKKVLQSTDNSNEIYVNYYIYVRKHDVEKTIVRTASIDLKGGKYYIKKNIYLN